MKSFKPELIGKNQMLRAQDIAVAAHFLLAQPPNRNFADACRDTLQHSLNNGGMNDQQACLQ